MGKPPTTIPEASLQRYNPERLTRWKLISQKVQQYWEKWSREVLQRYQTIYKWQHPRGEIQVGTLVLILDENTPPTKWPLARVISPYVARDGHIRVVKLRTANQNVIRNIQKLVPLPVRAEEDLETSQPPDSPVENSPDEPTPSTSQQQQTEE
uniref:DUF5641 domain-containing protein n=1 Tax=Bracon brevicornis TaxID=1563983 RepID=A0A6V7JG99_9HYME